MRILILGGNSTLGHKLFQVLRAEHDVFASFRNQPGLDDLSPVYRDVSPDHLLGGVDVLKPATVVAAIAAAKPQVVLNCVGIIKQLAAAHDSLQSIAINALFPHQLAGFCEAVGARLIHFSTDCIFSGAKGFYSEDDSSDADTLYGRTKYLGEVCTPGTLTIRTSFIGRDFFKQVGLLEWFVGNRNGRVRGFRRAIYSGLTTLALARLVADLIRDFPSLSGLYQVSSTPISKYELLVRISRALELNIIVDPCDDLPCDRSLDPTRFLAMTHYTIPEWDTMITDLAGDPTPYDNWKKPHEPNRS